jgi:hypothetical protein
MKDGDRSLVAKLEWIAPVRSPPLPPGPLNGAPGYVVLCALRARRGLLPLVVEKGSGDVSVAWPNFAFVARRYGITDRAAQFKMASEVAASIASAAEK